MRWHWLRTFPVATLLLLFFQADPLSGEETRQVGIGQVRFNLATPPGDNRRWLEAEVALDVQGPAGEHVFHPNYVDRLVVELNLSFQVGSGEMRQNRFYRASAEIPTVARGQRRIVRFYLPPEVVSRDNLGTEPQAYLARVSAGGVWQANTTAAMSSLVRQEGMAARFMERIESEAGVNAGILVPVYQTPFYFSDRVLRDAPSFIRAPETR